MDTVLLPELVVYGALMAAAAILGFWPELVRFKRSVHDHTALDRVRRAIAPRRHPSGGKS